ncbi:MAG: glycoside hydrolase family 9 protein [Omnitrophica WOR_2 bacterium]
MPSSPWSLNSYECFEAPAVVALFYHNQYEEGKQGGFEILQRYRRIAGNGNLRLGPAPDQWALLPKNSPRQVVGDELVTGVDYPQAGIQSTVHLKPEGNDLSLSVNFKQNIPAEWVGKTGFNLELPPDMYMGKTFFMTAESGEVIRGIFPHGFYSPLRPGPSGELEPLPLASGKKLVLSPEDPATRLEIEARTGELELIDGRYCAQNGWFVIRNLIPAGATQNAVDWRITASIDPGWRRDPVICYSQVGYHPRQKKVAAIELDPRTDSPGEAQLLRLDADGSTRIVKRAALQRWGEYLCYAYALFDFSEVQDPGIYRLEYENQLTSPFPVESTVYQKDVWQPALESFFPIQMCHMEVRDVYRLWHAACHLDDALQAPTPWQHFDSYVQSEETETSYAPLEHIPYLDAGGWHDAGDYDLAAGSQAHTTLSLAYTRELFGLDSDQTAVYKERRLVEMHKPDGIPDIVQQVSHGVENLLSGYRAAGHSFSGIIENSLRQYVQLGEPALLTDNQVSGGLPAGQADDRWAFTNRDTALEYLVCAALAASSRVLRGFEEALAQECLLTARRVWDREQSQPVKVARSCYVPGHAGFQEILAGAELLLATGEERYRARLIEQSGLVLGNIPAIGWAAARALPLLKDASFEKQFSEAVKAYAEKTAEEARQNPFGVPYPAETWKEQAPVWGVAWSLLQRAVNLYLLDKACPGSIDPSLFTAILGYVFGCHPCSNASLVSGVGVSSLTIAYGINRADWTHIPGGVVSGPALIRPVYPELMDPFPFLWQQKEYVIGGEASYIFLVLAVDGLLSAESSKKGEI